MRLVVALVVSCMGTALLAQTEKSWCERYCSGRNNNYKAVCEYLSDGDAGLDSAYMYAEEVREILLDAEHNGYGGPEISEAIKLLGHVMNGLDIHGRSEITDILSACPNSPE